MDSSTAYYISTIGNDTWSGTLAEPSADGTDGPFATLEAARDAIRARDNHGAVIVWVRGGSYFREQSFTLEERDSGTPDAPIVYSSFKDEEVRIIGGKEVNGFSAVTDPIELLRINKKARGHVLRADLAAQGITDLGSLTSRGFDRPIHPAHMELFFNDLPMTLSRYPNEGWLKIDDVPDAPVHYDGTGPGAGTDSDGFFYDDDHPATWKSFDDVWMHGYWVYDWANAYQQAKTIDTDKRYITFCDPQSTYGFLKGQHFFFLNVLEELDQPGEFYVDRKTGVLYFWPPSPLEESRAVVSILEEPLLLVNDVSYVEIFGLIFECGRADGIRIEGGSAFTVSGCTVRNLGNTGITVKGGDCHLIEDSLICEVGDYGINLDGGDCKALIPAGHRVENNELHHFSRWTRCYSPGVWLRGVGNIVSHNLFHDAPHSAIILGGNDHIVEFNEVHHVCWETGDAGAFYIGRNYAEQGNIVRYNFFHHIKGTGWGTMAVYLDDCSSGTTVFGNVFYDTQRAAMVGGGIYNTVENNIFVKCDPAIWVDGRGSSGHSNWMKMVYDMMKPLVDAMDYHNPPYSTRYPKLLELDKYFEKKVGVPPEGTVLARNIIYDSMQMHILMLDDLTNIDFRNNYMGIKPGFVDIEKMDFRLEDDSPAYAMGFQKIPFEEMGLRKKS